MTNRLGALVYSCLLMAAFGIGVAAFGPLLPELARSNGLATSQMGLIFPAMFAGTVPASLLVGFLIDRFGASRIIVFAIPLLSGAATALTVSRSQVLLLALSVLIGVGGGAGVPAANALVVRFFGERRVAAVNLVNVFFGVGAITGPALVGVGLSLFGRGAPALWFSSAIAVACLPFFARLAARPPAAATRPGTGAERSTGGNSTPRRGRNLQLARARFLFRSPLLWLIGGVLFFDVGTEQTLGGWMAVYMNESTTIALSAAALVVSSFWIAFTVGRLTGAAIGTRFAARWVLTAGLVAAIAGALVVALSTGRAALSIGGFILTGFGLGPVYPTTMALIGSAYASRAGTVIGLTAALGTAGGMALPWFEGVVIDSFGPPGAARLLVITTAAIALLSLSVIISIVRSRA